MPKKQSAAPEVAVQEPVTLNSPMSELVPLSRLSGYDKNPRDNSKAIDAVAKSIKDFGFLVPIVANSDGVLIAGHTRYAAAQKLGLTEVPVIWANHLTVEQQNAFRLIDNKTAELAIWDFDLLAGEIAALKETGIDLLPFGWTQAEIDCLQDAVLDDCLDTVLPEDKANTDIVNRNEAGGGDGITGAVAANKGSNVVTRDPQSVRFALGEINFFVDIAFYREWAHELRRRNGFDMERVITELATSLGVQFRPFGAKSEKDKLADQQAMEAAKALEQAKTGKTRAEVNQEAASIRQAKKVEGKKLTRITAAKSA